MRCGVCDLEQEAQGQLYGMWFQCGLFSSLTEVVRGGYARVIALLLLTLNLGKEECNRELALVLATAFWTATLCFWLSDLADSSRRSAGLLSFAFLGVGHAGLAMSTTLHHIILSAVFFGIGEGISTGLRALVGNDYSLHDECLVASQVDRQPGRSTRDSGHFDEKQCLSFKAFVGIWADVSIVINSVVIGVVGQCFGMHVASLAYAGLSIFAATFCTFGMPETKPPHRTVS